MLVRTLVFCCGIKRGEEIGHVVGFWRSELNQAHASSESEVYILSKKDEGGRHTPFFKGCNHRFYFRTTDT